MVVNNKKVVCFCGNSVSWAAEALHSLSSNAQFFAKSTIEDSHLLLLKVDKYFLMGPRSSLPPNAVASGLLDTWEITIILITSHTFCFYVA